MLLASIHVNKLHESYELIYTRYEWLPVTLGILADRLIPRPSHLLSIFDYIQ